MLFFVVSLIAVTALALVAGDEPPGALGRRKPDEPEVLDGRLTRGTDALGVLSRDG